ncbi:MAG: type II toxin-antitoxin system HicB family antitoxin [Segetibacter sp.]
MKQKYLVVIEKAENNYSAFSPDVQGCIATGETIEDTIVNMKEALEFHLEALDEVPEAKGLKYYIDKGIFDGTAVEENYFIAQVELRLPAIA